MKFTSEDLMKAMGLEVGDRIRVENFNNSDFEVKSFRNLDIVEYVLEDENGDMFGFEFIFNHNFEILPKPKRVGQLTCREIKDCRTCPLWWICFIKIQAKDEMETSLYEMLESFVVTDQEIHDLLKARLDKEVVEE